MNVDVDRLRAAAEAATAGPWEARYGGVIRRVSDAFAEAVVYNVPCACGEDVTHVTADDAAYIAAASPDVVLWLLDRLQAAEAAVERPAEATTGEKIRCPACARWLRLRRGKVPPHYSPDRAEYPKSCPGTSALGSPQDATGADLRHPGAESDHGDQREGEGLA